MHWRKAGSGTIHYRWVDTKLACFQALVGCMTLQHPLFPSFLTLASAPRSPVCRALLKTHDSDVCRYDSLMGAVFAGRLHGDFYPGRAASRF